MMLDQVYLVPDETASKDTRFGYKHVLHVVQSQELKTRVFEDICLVYLITGVNARLQMKYLRMTMTIAIINIFGYNVEIIWINISWLITNMYECPSKTFIVVVVLFDSCFPELSLTKLVKTGCRISSGKRGKIK